MTCLPAAHAQVQDSSAIPARDGALRPGTLAPGSVAPLVAGSAVADAWRPEIDGPPPPVPPEVVSRDAAGRVTVRAIKLRSGLRLDGQLDEEVYQLVPPITGLVQQVPNEGAPATEDTEAWIMFDARTLYVGARLWDSAPPSEWVADELRRDAFQLFQNDNFGIILDTLHDGRNGFVFYTTPLGAIADQQFANESRPNLDWNPVWDVRTGRFEKGWTVEMAIPFQSIRYRSGDDQIWGVQLRRVIRRKNELAFLTPLSMSYGPAAAFRVSQAATLVGVEVPGARGNFEVKPYGIAALNTDLGASPPIRDRGDANAGFDVKVSLSESLTADLTYNTDFAQVEVDEQQVNLTRFNLFFPEKREFFLEGQGVFDFASGGLGFFRGGGAARRNQGRGDGTTPTLFFSRRIGLQDGTMIPILGGGRVTGKIGAFDVGALTVQTEDVADRAESTNFTAVRVTRNVLRRSSIGAIFTNRSVSLAGDGANQAYGVDGVFSLYDNVELLSYFARTRTPGLDGRDSSYQGKFSYNADRYGLILDHLVVEDHFVPEVGFVRRDNFKRSHLSGRFSPRPISLERVRQFVIEGTLDYYVTADTGLLESRERQARFTTEFENGDWFGVVLSNNYERLHEPFPISLDVSLPVGEYDFTTVETFYELAPRRRVSGSLAVRAGSFWSGDIAVVEYRSGRVELSNRLSVEPSISVNRIDLREGAFTTTLVQGRVNYTFTPRMFFSGLMQYSSAGASLSSNLRFRWEYIPGSEMFVVYTEDRDTDPLRPDRFSDLRTRGLAVKMTRLFRF